MNKVSRFKRKATLLGCLAAVPLAVVGNALYAEDASAAFKIKISSGVDSATYEDTDGDGEIFVTGATIGGFTSNFTFATSKPSTGSETNPNITISSFETSSSGGGTLKIEVTDTGFTGKSGLPFLTSAATGLTVGKDPNASIAFTSKLSDTNDEFAGTTLSTLNFDLDPLEGEMEVSSLVAPAGTYALTLEAVVTHAQAGNSGFNGGIKQVPEPFTIMGAAVALGFGAYSKRKFKTLE